MNTTIKLHWLWKRQHLKKSKWKIITISKAICWMDHQFIQFIDDLTKDEWNLSPQPKALEIQKDSDFIDNIKYMSVRTKV